MEVEKRYNIVLEVNVLTGIQYARTHYGTTVLLKDSIELSCHTFYSRRQAHMFLKELRLVYVEENLVLDPSYVHPPPRKHPTYKDHVKNKGLIL